MVNPIYFRYPILFVQFKKGNISSLYFVPELGCFVNAESYLDKACSGKKNCEYLAVGGDLGQTDPCPGKLSYLEVDYTCIKGTYVLLNDMNKYCQRQNVYF